MIDALFGRKENYEDPMETMNCYDQLVNICFRFQYLLYFDINKIICDLFKNILKLTSIFLHFKLYLQIINKEERAMSYEEKRIF